MNDYYDYNSYFPCNRQPTGTQTTPSTPMTQTGGELPMFPLAPIGTTLPTGLPLGPAPAGTTPSPFPTQTAQTLQNTQFIPGYLKTQIGRRVRVEFLIGTNGTTDRIGTLVGVGASYILIRPSDTDDIMLCDLYAIKFVTFFY